MWGRRVTHWHTLHDSEACSTWTETPWRCCQVPRDGPQKPTNSFHPHSRPNIHHLITPLHLCGRIQKTSPEAEQETLGRTMRRTLPGAKEPRTSGTWSSLRHVIKRKVRTVVMDPWAKQSIYCLQIQGVQADACEPFL